jgi:hypothetical protein
VWMELPQDRVQWSTSCLDIESFPATRRVGRSADNGAIVRSARIVRVIVVGGALHGVGL